MVPARCVRGILGWLVSVLTGLIMEWQTTSTILDSLRDYENRAAWDRFVTRFRMPIVSFARKMGLPESDAEDLAQEALLAFAKAYRDGRYNRSKGRLSTWLFGIVYRQVLNARRKGARRGVQMSPAADGTSFWSAVPDDKVDAATWDETWQRTVLQQCIDRVRHEVEPTTFQAFEMTALAKRPPAEVASDLGITRNAVFIAKHRVVSRLRELQREYEHLT